MLMALPPAVHATHDRVETAIVREINHVRRLRGLHTVIASPSLHRVARAHSLQMLTHDALSHSSFTGLSFTARLARAGSRRCYGETLAWTPLRTGGARTIVNLWLHSAAHRAVLLDGRLRRVGVARVWGHMGTQYGTATTADWSS